MALFQRAADGYPVGSDNHLRQSYGPIPDTDLFQHHQRYGYEKVAEILGWEWSITFNRWRALVRFADGWRGFSWPKMDAWNSLEAFAHAAAQAIIKHQLSDKGLRPRSQWDGSDVTDKEIILTSLAGNGLSTSANLVEDMDSVVSAIVFGAFHQDSENCLLLDASAILEVGGYRVAELRWNTVSAPSICPITGQEIMPAWGYWPFLGKKPLSLDAFDESTKPVVTRRMSRTDNLSRETPAMIAGYFVLKAPKEESKSAGAMSEL